MKDSILILLYPNCVEFEVMLAAEFCNRLFKVEVATPTGKEHKTSGGFRLVPDVRFSEVKLDHCRGVLVPGGDPYDLLMGEHAELTTALFARIAKKQLPIGAVCAGPSILGKNQLLKGKKFTHGYGEAHTDILNPFWEGASFTDADVEVDGNIITAKPKAFVEFATRYAQLVGVLSNQHEQDRERRYYLNHKPSIDHITLVVSDLSRSRDFYDCVFNAMGVTVAFGEKGVFWAYDLGASLFEFRQARPGETVGPCHIAIQCKNHEVVGSLYAAALESGGRCNGEPGPRKAYTPNYYAGFFLDPDGYNIEAMFDC